MIVGGSSEPAGHQEDDAYIFNACENSSSFETLSEVKGFKARPFQLSGNYVQLAKPGSLVTLIEGHVNDNDNGDNDDSSYKNQLVYYTRGDGKIKTIQQR